MQTKQLLALVALAVGILTIPAAAIAGPAGHSALAQPSDLGPIVAPLSGCMTHLRWVPARGPGGGHYDWSPSSCVRYVSARGPGGGHYDYSSIASAIHGSTKPIAPRPASHAAAWGFDWGSAGIGAATVLGAFAIALAARTALHRRRIATP
ncbi:MAG TPA: hypothetical protein VFY36_08210 [Solirubrobacteraceae bacterium]|nr:hypothetical protein [Solirubrobacteraceae bacterium]